MGVAADRAPEGTAHVRSHRFPRRWRARWIQAPREAYTHGRRTVLVRRTISVTEPVPAVVPARVCADSRYVLFVNGHEVVAGPARDNPRRLRYDVVDLAPRLRTGTNVLAAVVTFYGDALPWWMPGPTLLSEVSAGGFLFEAELGDGRVVGSDASWEVRAVPGWDAGPPLGVVGRGRERIDLRQVPDGWAIDAPAAAAPDPDASDPATASDGWVPAVELHAGGLGELGIAGPPSFPFGPYGANPLAPPQPRPVEVAAGPDGTFVAERIVVGTLELTVSGPPGSTIEVDPSEFDAAELARIEATEPVVEAPGPAITLDGGRRTIETVDLVGFRTLRVTASDGADLEKLTVRERWRPAEGDASFACSDPLLERIWAVGRHTVSLCTLDAYVDCPTREQRAWTGDGVVHQMVDLATNTDWGMARRYPALTAVPRPDGMLPMAVAGDAEHHDIAIIPDWALHWVHAVDNLRRYVGDPDEVASLLGVAEGVLRWFEPFRDDNGLLTDVISWVIIDWASVHTQGRCAALNGLYGRALAEFAAMATWLGDDGRARWARRRHEQLAAGFEQLWDPERGRYVDSMVDGERRPMASQHAQAAAIVGGLAPPERHGRLVEVLTDEASLVHATFGRLDGEATPNSGMAPGGQRRREPLPPPWWDVDRRVVRAQPFFRYVVHDALAAAGRADLVPSQCRDWAALLERCDTSWAETWFGGTVSHGWSSTPTRDLMVHTLGVTPAAEGFTEARVDPALGDLTRARGRVPTPAGMIDVDVSTDALVVDSPVPIVHRGRRLAAGRHQLPGVTAARGGP